MPRIPLLSLSILALSLASTATAQRVSLQIVVRDSSGLVIPYASGVVLASRRVVGADRNGHIPVGGLRPGIDTVLVRAIGYHPAMVPVRATIPGNLAITVILPRAPFILPEVTVSADKEAFDPIRAFHDRARGSGGRFVARWQIARTGYIRASQTLQIVLGVRYEEYDPAKGGAVISFPGCRADGSRVSVFIDGRETASSPVRADDVAWQIDLVAAREIEAMEVYRRRSEIPIRFRTGDACAAVIIWTDQIAQ